MFPSELANLWNISQLYMTFLNWRFSKRLEHYAHMKGPFYGGEKFKEFNLGTWMQFHVRRLGLECTDVEVVCFCCFLCVQDITMPDTPILIGELIWAEAKGAAARCNEFHPFAVDWKKGESDRKRGAVSARASCTFRLFVFLVVGHDFSPLVFH